MNVSPISENSTNFNGRLIVKNKFSVNQNYLFNLHRASLENMIKDLPFDLFAEQSKSKKTITLSTNVEGTYGYIVRKNEQDFEKAAEYAIEDAKKKSKIYQNMVKTNEMLQCSKNAFANVLLGNFEMARTFDIELAKRAVKDFENYKNIPKINYINVPMEVQKTALINSIKYRIFRLFQTKTPEEKTFAKMRKEYAKELKRENKQIKTVNIVFPRF